MSLYNAKTLLEKSSGKFEIRKLVLPDGVFKKIWIPNDSCLYHRIHFKVKTKTSFKNSKYDVVDCFNQEPGENGKGCPICDEIQSLWAQWRKLDKNDKVGKKAITDRINMIMSEEIWVNAIDIDDEDLMFYAVRFTKPKFAEVAKIGERVGINNVTFRYKKDEGTPVKYTIVEDENPSKIKELKEKLDFLMSRSTENGGPIDLERIQRKYRSLEDYKNILMGADSDEENELVSNSAKSNVEIDEEAISIDDIGLDGEKKEEKKETATKKEEKKETATKKEEKKEEEISLEDTGLELEPIDLDLDGDKFIDVDGAKFKEACDKKDYDFCLKVYNFLVKEKKIKEVATKNEQVKSAYTYVKVNPIKMKE